MSVIRLGHDVCSIIDNFIFHDLYQKVLTELLHTTSDIYYLTLLRDDNNNNDTCTTPIIRCIKCNYYWSWAVGDHHICRHCLCKIPKGVDIDNKNSIRIYSKTNKTRTIFQKIYIFYDNT